MLPFKHIVIEQLKHRSNLLTLSHWRQLKATVIFAQSVREKQSKNNTHIPSVCVPVTVKPNSGTVNIGAELSGTLNTQDIIKTIQVFAYKESIKNLASQYGLRDSLYDTAVMNFRDYCEKSNPLPVDLHITLNDIIKGVQNPTDLFPYFIRYVKQMYPHLDCLEDLKKISDLRNPPNWYPEARLKTRKIIFHAGPTNSGKTYHALKRLMSGRTGVYCGPLKLLAVEVSNKCTNTGTPCDLITGEEKRYVKDEKHPANHVACSIEMVDLKNNYEVAVIDEIQLVRDPARGWAWTRALLGLIADEVHLCGEAVAIPIVQALCASMNERVTIKKYTRLTDLVIQNKALSSLNSVEPGDCIVCFNKKDIFTVSNTLQNMGKQVAVIYGSLPPGTKLAQAAIFNDKNNSCNILVATNAIGMGLNLHIRRIIFYSLRQPTVNEKGQMEKDIISVSSALQIAGRAGRYRTQWQTGYVTTFHKEDINTLKKLLNTQPEEILKAGLHPTAEQLELYAYYLPNTPLAELINIFVALCKVDNSLYFICDLTDIKFIARMIQHIPLPLRVRYVFCCAPLTKNVPFICTMFIKFARRFSENSKASCNWLRKQIEWPPKPPKSIADLAHLESVFDVLDIYLWLSYRFPDIFCDADLVRVLGKSLDNIINKGITELRVLLNKSEADDGRRITESLLKKQINPKLDLKQYLIHRERFKYSKKSEGDNKGFNFVDKHK